MEILTSQIMLFTFVKKFALEPGIITIPDGSSHYFNLYSELNLPKLMLDRGFTPNHYEDIWEGSNKRLK